MINREKGIAPVLVVLIIVLIFGLLAYRLKKQPQFPLPTPAPTATPTESPTPTPTPTPSPTKSATPKPSATPVINNAPPGAGYSRQSVASDAGVFTVSMIAADISSTRVIVDTASPGDCGNNCPVLPLADYVARNGAYAGVNGSYFCPADYASCAGKTNTFDTLLMNKDKVYFNSANNVYSNNPAVIFGGGYIRFWWPAAMLPSVGTTTLKREVRAQEVLWLTAATTFI